jgi:hypothetical protein
MDESAQAYWAEFERQTGEKPLSKTMCQRFGPSREKGEWGLLILTDTSLRYRKIPGDSWLSSLIGRKEKSPEPGPGEDLIIRRDTVKGVTRRKKKFLDFFFGSPFAGISISYAIAGTLESLELAIDPKSDILEILEKPRS